MWDIWIKLKLNKGIHTPKYHSQNFESQRNRKYLQIFKKKTALHAQGVPPKD